MDTTHCESIDQIESVNFPNADTTYFFLLGYSISPLKHGIGQ